MVVTFGIGHRDGDTGLSLFQTYTHDRGSDDQTHSGTGLTLTADFPRFFLRAAQDPKVNFTALDMTRISLGVRF